MPRTLLVADDSQTVHRIVEMACEGEDVAVVAVSDGDRAIAEIVEHHPDVVLADIAMPGRSGYDVAEFVRSHPELAHIPVVLMAGMFEPADEDRARRLGCVEVLVKPLKPRHVAERLKQWVSGAAVGAAPAPIADAAAVEAYFSRLDAAFKSLERPSIGAPSSAPAAGTEGRAAEAVPTLQELLSRLPEATRTRLTPPTPSAPESPKPAAEDTSLFDAIAARVLDELARRDDLLDEIARRVARFRDSSSGQH